MHTCSYKWITNVFTSNWRSFITPRTRQSYSSTPSYCISCNTISNEMALLKDKQIYIFSHFSVSKLYCLTTLAGVPTTKLNGGIDLFTTL